MELSKYGRDRLNDRGRLATRGMGSIQLFRATFKRICAKRWRPIGYTSKLANTAITIIADDIRRRKLAAHAA